MLPNDASTLFALVAITASLVVLVMVLFWPSPPPRAKSKPAPPRKRPPQNRPLSEFRTPLEDLHTVRLKDWEDGIRNDERAKMRLWLASLTRAWWQKKPGTPDQRPTSQIQLPGQLGRRPR
jgi:hypothetical protein